MTQPSDDGYVVAATEESQWVQVAERIALATSLQALFVMASRAVTEAASPTMLLETLVEVLPRCLHAPLRRSGDPDGLLQALDIPVWAAPFVDEGWALAVGEHRTRLSAPGRVAGVAWQPQLRVSPIISALNGDYSGEPLDRSGELATKAMRVRPIGHPDGSTAAPICLSDELVRPAGYPEAWRALVAGAALLPSLERLSYAKNWLWHLDSLLRECMSGIPAYWEGLLDPGEQLAATRDTLYDQSRLAGAIGISLFRHAMRTQQFGPTRPKPESPLMLISGEITPIQDYIFGFTPGGADADSIDQILRGRSTFLRLAVEIAAFRLCDQMHLPPGSVLTSAASKFTLLAPNTHECREIVATLQVEFDQWALDELHGQSGLCLARSSLPETAFENKVFDSGRWQTKYGGGASGLVFALARRAAEAARQRFQLCKIPDPGSPFRRRRWTPPLYLAPRLDSTADQFQRHLARAMVTRNPVATLSRAAPAAGGESMHIAGYSVTIASKAPSPHYTEADGGRMEWDLSTADSADRSRWVGRCKKPLAVYSHSGTEDRNPPPGTFRQILKGDIDHLGVAFQSPRRVPGSSLARIAILSREVEEFFSITVQCQLAKQFSNLITVFSGGDDYLFLGPSGDIMEFSRMLHATFKDHCQDRLSMSAGVSLPFQGGTSIADAVEEADEALAFAKEIRNAVGFAGVQWSWSDWARVSERTIEIQRLLHDKTLLKATAVAIAELLYRSEHATRTLDVRIDIEALLLKEAQRQGIGSFGSPPDLEANGMKARAFETLRTHLLFDVASGFPDQILVPLTLAYMTLQ